MREITADDTARMDEDDRDRVLDWLRRHGLDPHNTWSCRTVGPLVLAKVYVLDGQGRKQLDPRRDDEAWKRTRWLWRRAPLPQIEPRGTDQQSPTSGE